MYHQQNNNNHHHLMELRHLIEQYSTVQHKYQYFQLE
ncbi:hypothetical protein ACQ27_gp081 [Klebsiella phage K64-1]|nr:hypothetical protein ACQ27_gp081 [Klebsiella phage K64-1]